MNIPRYFVERKKLSFLVYFFVMFTGMLCMVNSPRQDMPNVDFNIVLIFTYYPGASPEDVEIKVTDPIEDELEAVDGIEEMSSFSIEGMSYIVIRIDPDADDTPRIKNDIRSAVDRVRNLPKEIEDKPVVQELKTTDFPILEVAISGDSAEELFLRKIAKDMESEFKALPDVGIVEKINYRKRETQILCDAAKMDEQQISFMEIFDAIRSRNIRMSAGTLESTTDEKKIVTFSEFQNNLEVGDVIVRSNFSGKCVRVSDVAAIRDNFKKRDRYCRTNGINSINLLVKRMGTADIIRLSEKIDRIIQKYQNAYQQQGISISKVVDYSYYTKSLLNIVNKNALIGFFLVCLCLFIFLDFRSAFWIATGIPFCILGSFIFFPVFSITTNQVTLITIIMVLGMIVDDAIVVGENIHRYQEQGVEIIKAAVMGTLEMFKPVMGTIITTMICFVPMFFMTGILGKFIQSIPAVVMLTLGLSLLESFTCLPAHLSSKKISVKKPSPWMEKLKKIYGSILYVFLKKRALSIIILVLYLAGSFGFYSKVLKFDLFPTEDFDLFYIVMEAKTGVSLDEMSEKVSSVEKHVAKIPRNLMIGYKTIIGDHRTDEAAADPSLHENWALISVFLHPSSKRNVRSEKIIEDFKNEVSSITGFVKLDVRELKDGPPVGEPITIRLVSDDIELCEKQASDILSFLHNTNGVHSINTSNLEGKKELRIMLDYDAMSKLGTSASDVANTALMAYDGMIATSLRREGEEIDFRIKLLDEQRNSLNILNDLQIPNNQNRLIRVKNIGRFEEGISKQTIEHYNGKKCITITAKVHDQIITSAEANQKIRKNFESKILSTPGLQIIFGGEEKETMESMKNFLIAFICAIFAIYFILVLIFDSFRQPILIMLAIPFGMIGVMTAFYFHHLPLSFMGLIGTLGMIGVVVNDSIVMVSHLNHLYENNHVMTLDLIRDGACTRLRPVILTTLTTVCGLLPSAYGWSGTEPFLVPMVLALSWGLLFATTVTLIIVPVLYSLRAKKQDS
ncbi:MAG: efflux RND transporter permease subunit [Candidatus Aureabacteria bacterium]|nr:efflux RND transporter permease subunit [Candidatus Auribacterota bacterium]